MRQKWMIIKVRNILSQSKIDDNFLTESCYNIVEMNFKTKKEAIEKRNNYRQAEYYIVQSYY